MERTGLNLYEARFSSRFLGRFRPGRKPSEPDQVSETPKLPKPPQEPPNHRITYNRTGNLSTTTGINEKVADGFMSLADMRRDFVVVDSDKPPERQAVQVGSDVLAFRATEPIRKLTEVRFRPKRFHTLVRHNDRFDILVHERSIDDEIRSRHFTGTDEYKEQFLKLLNRAVKSGTAEGLFHEKLGWQDNKYAYFAYMVFSGFELTHLPFTLSDFIYYFAINHPVAQAINHLPRRSETQSPMFYIRDWKEAWLPLVPVDKWAVGRFYLARHGNELVIPKEPIHNKIII